MSWTILSLKRWWDKPTAATSITYLVLTVLLWIPMAKPSEPSMTLAVNYASLSEAEIANLNELLIDLQEDRFLSHTVRDNEHIYSIVRDYTRFTDGRSKPAVNAIANAVAEASGLTDLNHIEPGQVLQLPRVPVRPLRTNPSKERFQNFDLTSLELRSCDAASCDQIRLPELLSPEQLSNLADASSLQVTIGTAYPTLATKVKEFVSEFGTNAILIPTGDVEIEFRSDDSISGLVVALAPAQEKPDKTRVSLFLIDTFSETDCKHGNLVAEAAKETLDRFGQWDKLKSGIKFLETDYWRDRKQSESLITQYIDNSDQRWAKALYRNELERIKNLPETPVNKRLIPALYLKALVAQTEETEGVAILSVSFFIRNQGIEILPDTSFFNRNYVFVAAANDNREIETVFPLTQPQDFAFNHKSPKVSLVTAHDASKKITSMFSSNGEGIEYIAPGSILGAEGLCKGQSDHGSSFATPRISSLFYKLVSDSSGLDPVRRVLIASDVESEFVEKARAAGFPRLDLIDLPSGLYGITLNNQIRPLGKPSLDDHVITVFKGREVRENFGLVDKKVQSIGGFYCNNNRCFVFRDPQNRWTSAQITAVSITTDSGKLNLDKLKENYKGAVLL